MLTQRAYNGLYRRTASAGNDDDDYVELMANNPSQDSQWKSMLLRIWEINDFKSIKQKRKVKNIKMSNKTCSDR